jgi:hypothetical protein
MVTITAAAPRVMRTKVLEVLAVTVTQMEVQAQALGRVWSIMLRMRATVGPG